MLSIGHFGRDLVSRLHHQANYFSEEHSERLIADLRELLQMDWSTQHAVFDQRKADLILSYGFPTTPQNLEKPFAFADGVAIIPVHGMLINRFNGSYSSVTGYNFIRSQMHAALADPDVKLLAYDYNTYGGTVAGCGELASEMRDARQHKPSIAVVDASCYSAGYFLASQQDQVIASPSSGVGSIGCISMHVDYSDMLKAEGIKVTFIRSSPRKAEANPYEALSDKAKKAIQTSVDYHAGVFIDNVVQGRGMEEADVRATEAQCYDPPEALEKGLIDGIAPPSDAISNFLSNGGISMQTTSAAAPVAPMTPEQFSQAIAGGIAQALPGAIASALPTALAAHDKAKMDRRTAILGMTEATKRQKLAAHLADNTGLTAEEIKPILANSPEEAAEQQNGSGKRSPFHTAMNNTANPNVGADNPANGGGDGDGDGGGGAESDTDAAARILGTYHSATGNKVMPIKKSA